MALNMNKLLSILTILVTFCAANEAKGNGDGFTIELIHRDSPNCPFHNPLLSQWQRMHIAFQKSIDRLELNSSASIQILPDPNGGTYLIKLSVGSTPEVKLAVADTGSDLIWLQCTPCIHCFSQNNPIFNPKLSSSFKSVPCTSKNCTNLPRTHCGRANRTCSYSATYNDGSFSYGEIATDTFTLDISKSNSKIGKSNSKSSKSNSKSGKSNSKSGISNSKIGKSNSKISERNSKTCRSNSKSGKSNKSVSFEDIVFGCGYRNHFANADENSEVSGIVGLGNSEYSLINQIGGKRFSYCLVPFLDSKNVSSKLHFGNDSAVGPGAMSTPMVLKPRKIFYYLTLLGLSVGNLTAESKIIDKGNIFIDSGTTFSFLPEEMYFKLETMVKKSIGFNPIDPNPRGFLRLCYQDLSVEDVPEIMLKFEGGDVKLRPFNSFVSIGDGIECLGFAPTKGVGVFGNVAHTNFLVEYDLENEVVSFMPKDCVEWD